MRSLNPVLAALAALALPMSTPVLAVAAATVETVQSPAWRDRGGLSAPLAPGMELKSGDVLRTGPGARAYLMLAEGSRVKLGEGARFTFHSRSLQPKKAFRGALDVSAGSFRFTSSKEKKTQPAVVAIRVGTAAIDVRGTDLWGRTNADGDMVALLEGRIDVTRAGQTTELAQPLTFLDAPRGPTAEVKALDPAVFQLLARQTDIVAGDGAAQTQGKWKVLAGTAASEEAALELYDRIRMAGFAASIRPIRGDGQGWRYELLLRGFPGPADAVAAAARLNTVTGLRTSVVR